MAREDEVLKQINRSGYPLQLRVEHEVTSTGRDHGWSVASREHPWMNPKRGLSGFIDIVRKHDNFPTFRLVIECKRIKADDGRQLNWSFLVPEKGAKLQSKASCLEVEGQAINDAAWHDDRVWDNVRVTPVSIQSEFCVLPSDEQRKSPILETLAADLLQSVEGLAHEEVSVANSRDGYRLTRLFIFPVIVTNAALTICRFDPSRIDIDNGTLDAADTEIETVPLLRFRKSLATSFPERVVYDLKEANRARERTVFIVTAAHIAEFLRGWDVQPWDPVRGFAVEKTY